MKKLFLAIFIPVLLILGTPALLASIMYDGSGDTDMPVHLYTEDADAKAMLFEELSASIQDVEDNETNDMIYNLHQDIINVAIFEAFRDENPNYLPTDDCNSDACLYVFEEPVAAEGFSTSFRLVGAWVDFEDDRFILNVFLEVNLNDGFTYKTIVETHFNFKDLPDKYELEFDKIRLGNLPIPKSLITGVLNVIDNQLSQVDLEEATDVSIGTLDMDTITYTLQKDEILSQIESSQEENDVQADLMQEVLSIIFEEELLFFDLEEEELILTAGVSKFRSEDIDDIPTYLYDMHYQEVVEGQTVIGEYNPDSFQPTQFLQDKFTEYVFNYALTNDNVFRIKERTFNKLIYSNSEGFADARSSYEYVDDDGITQSIELGMKSIWFEFEPDQIYVNVLFRIAGIESLLQIRADEVSTSNQELVFEFVEITMGKDEGEADGDYISIIDLEVFKQLFADLGDVEFGTFDEDGVLTITADGLSQIMQDGSQEGVVNVDEIGLIDGALTLTVVPTSDTLSNALDSFSTELENVVGDPNLLNDLSGVLDTTNEGPEQDLYNDVVALQNSLNDSNETVDPEQIAEVFENLEQLDSETQQEFLDTFDNMVDEDILNTFEGLYGGDDSDTTTQ